MCNTLADAPEEELLDEDTQVRELALALRNCQRTESGGIAAASLSDGLRSLLTGQSG